tara:strand:- start:35 stop:298 length:264 start_codon:yes stop_codon:yes gene_type:complete
MVFALGFGRVQPRSSRYVSMFSALLVYFTYTNLVTMACARIPNEGVGAMGILALVHVSFAFAAAYLFWRRAHDQPLRFGIRTAERTG